MSSLRKNQATHARSRRQACGVALAVTGSDVGTRLAPTFEFVAPHTVNAKHTDWEIELHAPRSDFNGYERALIDRFFSAGDRSSTGAIQDHCAKGGFQPAQASPGLLQRVELLRSDGARNHTAS